MAASEGSTVEVVVADVRRLWERFGLPPLDLKREPVSRFQGAEVYPSWCALPGIYMFADAGRVLYVGRALRASLGARLKSQCNSFGDPRWDEVIRSTTAQVLAAPLAPEDWYFAASLEAALIAVHRPPRSKRIS